jgi:hypothetical protein
MLVASFALLPLIVGLWIRSTRSSDEMGWIRPRGHDYSKFDLLAIVDAPGSIGAWWFQSYATGTTLTPSDVGLHFTTLPASDAVGDDFAHFPQMRKFEYFGFLVETAWIPSPGGGLGIHAVLVPFWLLALISLIPPIVWLKRRARRVATGYCLQCGYDLCASKERCPECGKKIEFKAEGVET